MKQKARSICNHFINSGCRQSCPLSKACAPRWDDDLVQFADRMNVAADGVKFKGFQ